MSKLEIHYTNGLIDYYDGENADVAFRAIDAAGERGAEWTLPFTIKDVDGGFIRDRKVIIMIRQIVKIVKKQSNA